MRLRELCEITKRAAAGVIDERRAPCYALQQPWSPGSRGDDRQSCTPHHDHPHDHHDDRHGYHDCRARTAGCFRGEGWL